MTPAGPGRTVSLRMKLRQIVKVGVVSLGLLVWAVSLPADGYARDGEIAEASRKPGGINPADIDWRCSIMAGRTDRAFIPCAAIVEQGQEDRTAAVKFLINNNLINAHRPAGPGPLRVYTDEEAQALGLIPPASGPYQRR
ncbi:MAG: hypothetical protein ACREJV_08250 [Candidatus Rokuibacteriota bacterium]